MKTLIISCMLFIGCNCFGQKDTILGYPIFTDSSNYVRLSIDTSFLPSWIHLDKNLDIGHQINQIIQQAYDKGFADRVNPNPFVIKENNYKK